MLYFIKIHFILVEFMEQCITVNYETLKKLESKFFKSLLWQCSKFFSRVMTVPTTYYNWNKNFWDSFESCSFPVQFLSDTEQLSPIHTCGKNWLQCSVLKTLIVNKRHSWMCWNHRRTFFIKTHKLLYVSLNGDYVEE